MKYSILFGFFLLSTQLSSLRGQNPPKWQLWVEAATSFGFLDADPFKLGFGGSAQLSLEKRITTKSTLGVVIGGSKMSGYNRIYGEYSYHVLPSGFQYVEQNTALLALGFFDAGLRFKHRSQEASCWSWSVGVNASFLFTPIGQYYERLSLSFREPVIGEDSYLALNTGSTYASISSLDKQDFARYDLSAEATLFYEITKGCALKASFRQGTRNLINPRVAPRGDAQHYLSMVGVGFSVRLR